MVQGRVMSPGLPSSLRSGCGWPEKREPLRNLQLVAEKFPARSSHVWPIWLIVVTTRTSPSHFPLDLPIHASAGISRVILHRDHALHRRKRIDHQEIGIGPALENLERHVVVGRARNAQHVALRFGILFRKLRAVFVALLQCIGQIRNRAFAHNAAPRRNGADRAEFPEVCQRLGVMGFEIPIGGIHRLPNAVEIGVPGNAGSIS